MGKAQRKLQQGNKANQGKGKKYKGAKVSGGQPPQWNPGLCDQIGHPSRQVSYNIRAVDPDGESCSYTLLNGPGNLDANTGLYTWTPAAQQTGSFPIAVQATDTENFSTPGGFRINVVNQPPVIQAIPSQTIQAGATLDYFVNAFDPDGDTPLTYSMVSGPGGFVPNNLSNHYQWIVPAAQNQGPYPVTIQVTDALGASTQAIFTVQVH
jgi:hypothetical protein